MAPSSNNGQHASIISITDKETKAKIAAEKNVVDFVVTENLDSIYERKNQWKK